MPFLGNAHVEGDQFVEGNAGQELPTWHRDDLLDLLFDAPESTQLAERTLAPQTPQPEDTFDSQLTLNEDPMEDSPETRMQKFSEEFKKARNEELKENELHLRLVERSLQSVCDQHWCELQLFQRHEYSSFQACADAIAAYILSEIGPICVAFKVGITENLYARWMRVDCGYAWDKRGDWNKMVVLFAAKRSKGDPESTGEMEKKLIFACKSAAGSKCLNRDRAGGEGASDGSPHFVYCVYQQ